MPGQEADFISGRDCAATDFGSGGFPCAACSGKRCGACEEIMPQDGEFYCMDPQKDGERSLAEYGNRIYAARVVRPVKDSASRRVFLRSNQSVNRDTGDTENRTPFGTDAAINAL